jgi:hypothetical protein
MAASKYQSEAAIPDNLPKPSTPAMMAMTRKTSAS